MVIFTSRRIIAVNVQGLTGKKRDYSSLPYSKVQAFSLESAGVFDLDAELELWFSGLGKVKFEFNSKFDVRSFSKFLGRYILLPSLYKSKAWILHQKIQAFCSKITYRNSDSILQGTLYKLHQES